jgi:hypothetical protein
MQENESMAYPHEVIQVSGIAMFYLHAGSGHPLILLF